MMEDILSSNTRLQKYSCFDEAHLSFVVTASVAAITLEEWFARDSIRRAI